MARGGNRSGRDPSEIANDELDSMLLPTAPPARLVASPVTLDQIDDNRFWNPLGDLAPALSLSGGVARIGLPPKVQRPGRSLSPRIGFHAPNQVAVCVRRSRRKEVLFALGRAGGRGRGRRHPRRTWRSNIHCR